MKRLYVHRAQPALHLDEREMHTDLGSGNYIFVGSSCDMWAKAVPLEWLQQITDKCKAASGNRYLMQTKNPVRLCDERIVLSPAQLVFCTTLETNRDTKDISQNAPSTKYRAMAMEHIHLYRIPTTVTVEPIMDFDLEPFTDMIVQCHPCQVNIGADSGCHGLPEPSAEKVRDLITRLENKSLQVVRKRNLQRILGRIKEW